MNAYAVVVALAGLGVAAWAAMRTEVEEIHKRMFFGLLGVALLVLGISYL